jgi:hypothetical protein
MPPLQTRLPAASTPSTHPRASRCLHFAFYYPRINVAPATPFTFCGFGLVQGSEGLEVGSRCGGANDISTGGQARALQACCSCSVHAVAHSPVARSLTATPPGARRSIAAPPFLPIRYFLAQPICPQITMRLLAAHARSCRRRRHQHHRRPLRRRRYPLLSRPCTGAKT